MINGKRVLAVIPARGGSKRTPRKNIKDFRGKPLIVWTIDAAEKSKYIDMCFISTEDAEIGAVAEANGGTVMFRHPELATDEATNEDVLRHVLQAYPADWVVLLQPTSPLRTAEDIDAVICAAQISDACVSYRPNGSKNGAVYAASAEWLLLHDFTATHTKYVMPLERSLDIDMPEDFEC